MDLCQWEYLNIWDLKLFYSYSRASINPWFLPFLTVGTVGTLIANLFCYFIQEALMTSHQMDLKKLFPEALMWGTFLFCSYNLLKTGLVWIFFNVALWRRASFLTTIYVLYFSHYYTHYKLHFLHYIDLLWAAFHVLHQHLSFWLVGTPSFFILVQLVHRPTLWWYSNSNFLFSQKLINYLPCQD